MSKVMVVEDDANLREIYGIRIAAEGYEVVSAGDGEEALAMAVREKPNLILSDVMMPKISGFDMLDILRTTPETEGIKIIMMTALSGEDQRQRGERLGADRYLVKSQVGIEDVVNAVHEILGDKVTEVTVEETPAAPAAATPAPASQPAPAAPTAAEMPVAPGASFGPETPAAGMPQVSPEMPNMTAGMPSVAPEMSNPSPAPVAEAPAAPTPAAETPATPTPVAETPAGPAINPAPAAATAPAPEGTQLPPMDELLSAAPGTAPAPVFGVPQPMPSPYVAAPTVPGAPTAPGVDLTNPTPGV